MNEPGREAHSFDPIGGRGRWMAVNSRPVWSTVRVTDQTGLHSETLSQRRVCVCVCMLNKQLITKKSHPRQGY